MAVLPEPDDTWSSQRASATLHVLAPRVVLFVFRGHLDGFIGSNVALAMRGHAHASPTPLKLFFDAETLSGYESSVRVDMANAILESRKRFDTVHVLAQSKLVAMGVSVANLALGGLLRGYADRPAFEKAMREATTDRRPRPDLSAKR